MPERLRHLARKFTARGSLRNVAALAGGSTGGFLVTMLLAPALTRLYNPEAMGLFGVFGAVVAVLSIIVTLGFDRAIVGAVRRSDAYRYVAVSTLSLLIMLLAVGTPALIAWAMGGWTWSFSFGEFALALLATALAALFTVGTNWAIRVARAGVAGIGIFVNLAGRILFQLLFGFVWGGLHGLIAGEVAGRFLALFIARYGVSVRALSNAARRPKAVWTTFRRGYRFPVYLVPASALEVVLVWAPPPIFALTYGVEAGGLLTLVQRLVSAPLTVASQSLVQVFHVRATGMLHTQPARIIYWLLQVSLSSLAAMAAACLVLAFYSEAIFSTLFGKEWGGAGIVALIWTPLLSVQLITLFSSRIFIMMEEQRMNLVVSMASVAIMVVSVPAAHAAGYVFHEALLIMVALLTLLNFLTITYSLYLLYLLKEKSATPL